MKERTRKGIHYLIIQLTNSIKDLLAHVSDSSYKNKYSTAGNFRGVSC